MSTGGYHSRSEESRSTVAIFAKSRRMYEAVRITKSIIDDDETDSLTIGTGTHAICLKDAIELDRIRVIPKEVLAKNGARSTNAYEEWATENAGFTLIKEEQLAFCRKLSDAVHSEIGRLIDSPATEREKEVYWTRCGIDLRCKVDIVVPMRADACEAPWDIPHNLILDLKTAKSLEPWAWRREVRDRRLWLQDSLYSMGIEHETGLPCRFAFAIVEKSEPYRVRMRELSEADRATARRRTDELLHDLRRCRDSGDFSESGEGMIEEIIGLGEFE